MMTALYEKDVSISQDSEFGMVRVTADLPSNLPRASHPELLLQLFYEDDGDECSHDLLLMEAEAVELATSILEAVAGLRSHKEE